MRSAIAIPECDGDTRYSYATDQPLVLLWPFTRALASLAMVRQIKADPAIAAEQMIKMTRRLAEEICVLTDIVMVSRSLVYRVTA